MNILIKTKAFSIQSMKLMKLIGMILTFPSSSSADATLDGRAVATMARPHPFTWWSKDNQVWT